jgi:hypothetical protein
MDFAFVDNVSQNGTHEKSTGVTPVLEGILLQKVANLFNDNEKRVYLDKFHTSMLLASEIPRPRKVRKNIVVQKVMI